jgi:hypothetical protein
MGLGFTHVINTIDKRQFRVSYDDFQNMNKYDYALFSLTSYYDAFSLYAALRQYQVKTKIIIGGAAVLNIYPFIEKIYAACFGRCDTQINDILNGAPLDNVYCREYGVTLYDIGQATCRIGDHREHESSVGCRKKCFFCEYGFRYKFVDHTGQYQGYSNNETFFEDIDFKSKAQSTAGLDGLTEKERYIVNKPLSNEAIVTKLNTHVHRNIFRLKLYTIAAYPFTEGYDYQELIDTIAKARTNPLTIMIGLSHFVPMPLTPMEEEKVLVCELKRLNPVQVNNIRMMTYYQSTSYKKAIINALFNRMRADDAETLKGIFTIKVDKFIPKIMRRMPHIIDGGYVPVEYIKRPFRIDGMQRLYERRKSEYQQQGN